MIGQLVLVNSVSPYYGLYYNTLFIGGKQPTEIFQIPEPVYGLDQIVAYIKENPSLIRKIFTSNAPHIVQSYLPDYQVISNVFWWRDDANNLLILKSLGVEYVIIGKASLQYTSNIPLKETLDKYAELLLVAQSQGISLAYLYRIPRIY